MIFITFIRMSLMKRIKYVLILLIAFIAFNNKGYAQTTTPIEHAFESISKLRGFERFPDELAKERYSMLGGKVAMVGYGNADPRNQVLEILDKIPNDQLCYEFRFGANNVKIERYYLSTDKNGNDIMLYVFVGTGGNDLVAVLFTDAPQGQYKSIIEEVRNYNNN